MMSLLNTCLRARRGTSLPEIVTVAGLFLLLLTGLISMTLGTSRGYSMDSSKLMADDTTSLALQSMAREVRAGSSISVNEAGNSLTTVMPAVTDQGDYDRSRTGDTVQYYLSSGKLYRKRNTETARVIARNVSGLRFVRSGSSLSIEVTSTQQVGNRTSATTMSTQVTLRNEAVY